MDYIGRLNRCVRDERSPMHIRHTYKEMLTQSVSQIACDFEEADDCGLFRDDSVLKLCVGKSPASQPLSFHPTISRLENKLSIREFKGALPVQRKLLHPATKKLSGECMSRQL